MLKISERQTEHAITMRLEGRLVGPWVTELKKVCDQHLEAKQFITLEVAEVTFTDRAGLVLLLRLRAQGVTLANCSPFLEEELKTAWSET